jgi:PAS domain S-box-containing protein
MGGHGELDLNRFLESQRELAKILLRSDTLDEVAMPFLEIVARLLGWEAGALWEVPGEDGEELAFLAHGSVEGLDAAPLWERGRSEVFDSKESLPGKAWDSGKITWISDRDEQPTPPALGSAWERLGLTGSLAIPMPVGEPGGVVAVAEFHTKRFAAPPLELIDLLSSFADQLATFVSRRRAEAAGRAGESFKSTVLASSLDCIIGMDHEGRVIEFNEAAQRLFGYSREEAIGSELASLIIPDELRERHREGLRRYLETERGALLDRRVELSAIRRDGTLLPVELAITRVAESDPPVFTGFLRDLSQKAETERIRSHVEQVVRGAQDAVFSKDLDARVTTWNPAAERLYGYTAEEAIGQPVAFIVPPDHQNEERVILDRIVAGEPIETYETERIRKDGQRVDVSLTVSPIRHPILGIVGASITARDITLEKRRRRAQEFLVTASRALDSSLDPIESARTIVSTAVPELAEICVIDFVREDGRLGNSVVAGADPEAAARLERIRRESPLDPNGSHPVAQVLREGRPMIWRDLTSPGVASDVAQSDDHLQLMKEAGYNSAAVIELKARGRTLGALSFLHARPDLRYEKADLDLLVELADRAAIALDNARLYRERDRIAESLQRGLRPPSPAYVEGLDISVVFEAAGEGVEIGGDLYDVLPTDDGCWILIGDVAGKGSTAAGVSVAVRHSVRGLTREIERPAEVLTRVNEMLLEGSTLNDFATAMLIRMRRLPEGWEVELAAAGHPAAVHVTDEGPVQMAGGSVLGALDEARIAEHSIELKSEETLVLCTDGWLEAGPVAGHRESEALAEMAHSLAGMELFEMTDALRQDAIARSGGNLRDDMVVMAVRPDFGGKGDAARDRLGYAPA